VCARHRNVPPANKACIREVVTLRFNLEYSGERPLELSSSGGALSMASRATG